MEENGFHQPDNQFSLVKIWYFFKNWPPEWRIPWKIQFHWIKKPLPFESVSEKNWRKRFPLAEIRFFKKCWPPPNYNNGFQKIWMKESETESPLPLAVIKDTFNIYFQEMKKTASNGRTIWDIQTKRFSLAIKSVSSAQNEGFVSKLRFH